MLRRNNAFPDHRPGATAGRLRIPARGLGEPERQAGSGIRDYLRQMGATPRLSAEEERDLGWRIITQNCPASREHLARANRRQVVDIARRHAGRGLTLVDLIEEGDLGLMRAIDDFDPSEGARFSTTAGWWIKRTIRRALLNAARSGRKPDVNGAAERRYGVLSPRAGAPPGGRAAKSSSPREATDESPSPPFDDGAGVRWARDEESFRRGPGASRTA